MREPVKNLWVVMVGDGRAKAFPTRDDATSWLAGATAEDEHTGSSRAQWGPHPVNILVSALICERCETAISEPAPICDPCFEVRMAELRSAEETCDDLEEQLVTAVKRAAVQKKTEEDAKAECSALQEQVKDSEEEVDDLNQTCQEFRVALLQRTAERGVLATERDNWKRREAEARRSAGECTLCPHLGIGDPLVDSVAVARDAAQEKVTKLETETQRLSCLLGISREGRERAEATPCQECGRLPKPAGEGVSHICGETFSTQSHKAWLGTNEEVAELLRSTETPIDNEYSDAVEQLDPVVLHLERAELYALDPDDEGFSWEMGKHERKAWRGIVEAVRYLLEQVRELEGKAEDD